MFHTTGYTATGIKDIVNAADVPKGSFYNHFESKEVFGKEVVDFYFSNALPNIKNILEEKETNPIDRLRNYFESRMDCIRENGYSRGCLMGNFSLEVADHSELIRESIAEHFQTWKSLIESCISDAKAKGHIKNQIESPQLAEFILNSWEGALLRMRADKNEKPFDDFMNVIFNLVLA
ncbi:TPA: TetR family transcriptional regulator C-terminal domain-containing protein [Proteus mirabilis]